jgi:O-acetylserine/cysteine efflux transporter
MLVLSLVVEGPARDLEAVREVGAGAVVSLAYTVLVATLAGYGAWYWLLGKYDSSTVSGFPLLAPVAALSSSWLVLDETVTPWQLTGSALVVGGVAFAIWRAGAKRPRTVSAPAVAVHP